MLTGTDSPFIRPLQIFLDAMLGSSGSEINTAVVPALRAAAFAIADDSHWAVRNRYVLVRAIPESMQEAR